MIAQSRDEVIDDQLPTLAELGIPFVEVPSPIGVMVPGGVPDEVLSRLDAAIKQATRSPSFVEGMTKIYIPAIHYGAEDGDAYVRQLRENVELLLPKLRN